MKYSREFEKKIETELKQGIEFSIDLQVLVDMLVKEFEPEDIFGDSYMQQWAERMGYIPDPRGSDEDEQRVRY